MVSKVPLDFSNFELEITNRCNLECLRCARTDFIEQFPKAWQNYDLNLSDFKKFINPVIDQVHIFEFKGTMGDPIFHPNFIDWIKWAKSIDKKVKIHTNGQSGPALWRKLSLLLDNEDTVILGIDGLPSNFMYYRINARWKNIEHCVEELKGICTLVWQYIIFKYNQDNVEEAKQLSIDLGFDNFMIMNSNRWLNEKDWLKPNNAQSRPSEKQEIDPDCFKNPMHIVTADGYYMPCCYLIDHHYRYKTPWAKTFDIQKVTINDVIKSSVAMDFFAKLTNESAPNYCRFNCGKCNGI
jgi:MoaA/NifB/PqqE/SkfB family radical SAM enzyme